MNDLSEIKTFKDYIHLSLMINKILFGVIPAILLYFYILRSERSHGVAAACINLGKICDPKKLLKEIENTCML